MITIIDLGISNIKSITRGFMTQGFEVEITYSPDAIHKASSVVLPGVGAFPKAVEILEDRGLFQSILDYTAEGKPLLGVCLGMQLLFTDGMEHTLTKGLGVVDGHVMRFPTGRKVPHMGWNEVVQTKKSIIFDGVPDRSDFYFVHSFIAEPDNKAQEIAWSDHSGRFTSAVQKGNVFGVQFHPEKSQAIGLMLLRNFALLTEQERLEVN